MDRIRDPELMKLMRSMPCALKCRTGLYQVSGHHIKSRGSFGPDIIENLIPLCFYCHTKIHQYDLEKMISYHPEFRDVIESKGWEIEVRGEGRNRVLKLFHPVVSRY